MSLSIGTNVNSLMAQRSVNKAQNELSSTLARLSSGMRINSAKDDAAGLAIAERMTSQIQGLDAGSRNANDGISVVQTAEGSLTQVAGMLQRMRDLGVQSGNSSATATDKQAMQDEFSSLRDEIQRVAESTRFNGTKLLDGTYTTKSFAVGSEGTADSTITINDIANLQTNSLGNGDRFQATQSVANLTDFATAIADGDVTVNGISIGAIGAAADEATRATQVVSAVNAIASRTGVSASLDNGAVVLSSQSQFRISGALDAATPGTGATAFGFGNSATAGTVTPGAGNLDSIDLTASPSTDTLATIDAAISTVNSARSKMGSLQSRFENVVAINTVQAEKTQAARGRILDADFASETARLTRNQILQQAGTAMLAQANQLPQQVLSLLR